MYNHKQLDIVYDIKRKMLIQSYWDNEYIKVFPGFSFCEEGRYVWQQGNLSDDEVFLSNLRTYYTSDKDTILGFLTAQQYKFLMDNIDLFHTVYRIGDNLVVRLI